MRRRRQCGACDRRFTTYETAEAGTPMVIKRDGRREPFFPAKLREGLALACRKRPVATEALDALVDALTLELMSLDGREISSGGLGERVMAGLRRLDPIAYVRFASVYRAFEDVGEFAAEAQRLKGGEE